MHHQNEIQQHGYLQIDRYEYELITKNQINQHVESKSLG